MQEVSEHIKTMRQRICPRTSYATSGSAASTAYCVVSSDWTAKFDEVSRILKSSGEFDKLVSYPSVSDVIASINGHVLVLCGVTGAEHKEAVDQLLANGRTKLILVLQSATGGSITEQNNTYSCHTAQLGMYSVVSCFNYHKKAVVVSGPAAKGFNGQPSVQTGTQFRFLWSPSTPQVNEGKDRVLQRLADKTLHTGGKLTTQQWDGHVRAALAAGLDDYGIYSMIREKTLGSSIAKDLEKQILQGTASSSSASGAADGADGGEEGDGRANHMVSRTLDSVPPALRQRPGAIRRFLDYGCAEGAITAVLGKQLGLTADCTLGADVRSIPSVGFTFVQLPAESENPPAVGSILPTLADRSVDLITASMVFHHVTHVKAALLELRRIISPTGALIIREHHCTSADMGAFLDITHGLYSLSWSTPVEWPDFIAEYKAFYRGREEWDALIKETGFTLAVTQCGQPATRNYRAAEVAIRKPNGYFPNVIQAYYAVYTPTPGFQLPPQLPSQQPQPRPAASAAGTASTAAAISVHGDKKRALDQDASTSVHASSAAGAHCVEQGQESKRAKSEQAGSGSQTISSSTSTATAEGELFESTKYPGRFYRINKVTGAAEWV